MMKKSVRLPSYPLITHDPNFSIWMPQDNPAAFDTVHWSNIPKQLLGMLTIDGVGYRFLGRNGKAAMKVISREVTPLSTVFVLGACGVQLTMKFTSPLLLDDLDICSTPVTYIQFAVEFTDGKPHTVDFSFSAMGTLCCNGEDTPKMRIGLFKDHGLSFGYMGQYVQAHLKGSGDRTTPDSGYAFLACREADGEIVNPPSAYTAHLQAVRKISEPCAFTVMIAYDEVASINYFGRILPGYWARNGKTITEALYEFADREDEILRRCEEFDRRLLRDAKKLGGEDYGIIVSAAYRQSVAAHKLAADVNGELLFISKEDDSNGCAATVDVSYPSIPLFLLYRPELVAAMCRPIFKFARMPIWHYDFAPHDAGRYPIVTGQVYAALDRVQNGNSGFTYPPYYLYPKTAEAYRFETQMPVEESGNMLLMLAAVGYASGDWSLAEENLDLLRQWCRYLLDFGEDPGEQLCTDDFAGHLAHNVNLSAKATMGVAAFGMILKALGEAEEGERYAKRAAEMAESWLRRADQGGYTSLTFDGAGWSQKYNLVWDKLFGLKLLPDSFYETELASYLTRMADYGLPLDSRCPSTKSDWTMWCASMADDRQTFVRFVKPMVRYLAEAQPRVPFCDLYDTEQGIGPKFVARSVQGGLFMPLLMAKWRKKQ